NTRGNSRRNAFVRIRPCARPIRPASVTAIRPAGAPMRRREFITLIGGAAAWPLAARAQQSATPVIGPVDPRSPEALAERLRRFRAGLRESGFAEGENVRIEYRWAENRMDRLSELTADLVRRQVAVIVTPGGTVSTRLAKQATTTIPIVFVV